MLLKTQLANQQQYLKAIHDSLIPDLRTSSALEETFIIECDEFLGLQGTIDPTAPSDTYYIWIGDEDEDTGYSNPDVGNFYQIPIVHTNGQVSTFELDLRGKVISISNNLVIGISEDPATYTPGGDYGRFMVFYD